MLAALDLRCFIVDDNKAFLESAATLLEREGMSVVGVASNGEQALKRTQELHPDVLLVDITLGTESGFDLARRLVENNPGVGQIIMISTYVAADFADLIEKTPAVGFLAKSELSASSIRQLLGVC